MARIQNRGSVTTTDHGLRLQLLYHTSRPSEHPILVYEIVRILSDINIYLFLSQTIWLWLSVSVWLWNDARP